MNTNILINMPNKKIELIYPELSYQIVGAAFKVFNELGYGMSEKYYQRAFAKALEAENIPFKQEYLVHLHYDGQPIGRCFLDFVVADKIVVETKVRQKLGYTHIKQVMNYLKATRFKLAILIYFTSDGVKYRRVLNTA